MTALFYLSYFTKSLLMRRNGITANRMGKGEKPAKTRRTEILLSAATAAMAAIQVLSIFNIIPSFNIPLYIRYAGTGISATGVICFIAALFSMKDSWRAGIDASSKTELRTGGVMRISRNPAFLGFDLFYTGTALALPNLIIIPLTLFCVTLFHLQILEEEKFLTSRFPDSYPAYRLRVRRYF